MADESHTTDITDKTMLEALAENPSQFDHHTIRAIADAAMRRIARLEGYSDGLRRQLTAIRRAAGCDHD